MNQLIYEAVLSNNKAQQENAEKNITMLRSQNPEAFLLECSAILGTQSENEIIRQSSATVLSRSVGLKHLNRAFWDHVSPSKKLQIKQKLISSLVDGSDKIRRAAGNAIASIASIEIQRGEWLDLIETLNTNTQNPDPTIRTTAATVLGFICEQLKQSNQEIRIDIQKNLLTGILSGIKHSFDNSIMLVGLTALRNAMPFLGSLVAEKNIADYIIKQLLEASKSQSHDICQVSIQTLIEFCKASFENLDNYISLIYQATESFLSNVGSSTILTLELWDQVGQQYLDRKNRVRRVATAESSHNHLLKVHEPLTKQVLSLLLIVDGDQQNELREAAIRTMSTIADCCGSIVFSTVTAFVNNSIISTQWKYRQASVIAFSTLCQSQDRQIVQQLLTSALDIFMNLLQDENKFVVQSTLDGLARIFQFHAQVFLTSPKYEVYITALTNLLVGSGRTSELACKVIKNITESLSSVEECPLRKNIFPLLNTLSNCVFSSNKVSEIYICFSSIVNLMNCCNIPEIACRYIEYLMSKFNQIITKSELDHPIKSGILTAMYTSLLAMRNCTVSEQLLKSLLDLINGHFQAIKDVDYEGLYVIAGLSLVFKRILTKYLEKLWPYIVHSLAKVNEPAAFKAALNCISDIARSLGPDFNSKFQFTMDLLINAMNSDISRDIKLIIFACLSDCFVSVGRDLASKYLKSTLDIVDLGLQGAIELSKHTDQFEYAENLKEASMDLYQCINYTITSNTNNINPILISHFSRVVPLVIESCKRSFNPTLQYLMTCIETLTDTAYVLRLTDRLSNDDMRNLVNLLREHQKNNHRYREVVEYTDRMIFNRL